MYTALTPSVARDLGRTLRFLRHGRNMTLFDVAKRAGMSATYLQNLEGGARTNATEETYRKVSIGLGIPENVVMDLLLRARMMSALERRGLTAEQSTFVWRGVEQRLAEQGVELKTDIARVITEMLEPVAR